MQSIANLGLGERTPSRSFAARQVATTTSGALQQGAELMDDSGLDLGRRHAAHDTPVGISPLASPTAA